MKLDSQQLKDRNYKAFKHFFSLIEDKTERIVIYYCLNDTNFDNKFTHTIYETEKFKRWFYKIHNFNFSITLNSALCHLWYKESEITFSGYISNIQNEKISSRSKMFYTSVCYEKIRSVKCINDLLTRLSNQS